MSLKEVLVRRLIGVLLFALAVVGNASAETDYAWRFDTSARAAAVTTPVVTATVVAEPLQTPAWVEGRGEGAPVRGCLIIFR